MYAKLPSKRQDKGRANPRQRIHFRVSPFNVAVILREADSKAPQLS